MTVIDKNFNGQLSRDINDYPEGVVIVIDKPYRWTSADVIRKIKYAAIHHFCKKNLKVGHAGTLDPLATGVLLVCIGNACKNAEKLQASDKEYVAGVCFGATTPSYDLEKDVDRMFPLEGVNEQSLRELLPSFIGEQEQVAPLFSAKMVDGVRAYELARKMFAQGKTLDDAAADLLRVGRIRIDEMELLEYCPGVLSAGCSTGASPFGLNHPINDPLPLPLSVGLEGVYSKHPDAYGPQSRPLGRRGQTPQDKESASDRINVAAVPEGLPIASIRVACTKGTYIRALARDLGERMHSGAFLSSLQRSRSGQFRIENALSVDDIMKILYI